MSKQEFELYLSLLGRFLRLSAGQRGEIADELRDHLEERLSELRAGGLSEDEAIRRTLDEFGDAAELASHFTHLARRRRRRVLMRCTFASIAAASAVILIAFAMWPADPGHNMVPRLAAQQPPASGGGGMGDMGVVAVKPSPRDLKREAVEAKLSTEIEGLEFDQLPLQDALEMVAEKIKVNILIDESSLEDEGIQPDQPVTFSIKYTAVSAATAIELILEKAAGRGMLAWVIRGELVYVQSAAASQEDLEIEVHNVRDLLAGVKPVTRTVFPGMGGLGGGMGGGFFQVEDIPGVTGVLMQGGGGTGMMPPDAGALGGGDMGGTAAPGFNGQSVTVEIPAGKVLMDVITGSTHGPWMDIDGTGGTIEEFDGMLVIRQSQKCHREIKELLAMLRATTKAQPARR